MAFCILQLVRPRGEQATCDPVSGIDYFGPAASSGQAEAEAEDAASGGEAEAASGGEAEDPVEVGGRRKKKSQDLTVTSKKRKKGEVHAFSSFIM